MGLIQYVSRRDECPTHRAGRVTPGRRGHFLYVGNLWKSLPTLSAEDKLTIFYVYYKQLGLYSVSNNYVSSKHSDSYEIYLIGSFHNMLAELVKECSVLPRHVGYSYS